MSSKAARIGGSVGFAFAVVVVLGLLGLIVFRVGWVNYIENYELGYQFDSRNGKVTQLSHTGYIVTTPIMVKVHTVDLRPMQVCVNANARVLNCKLVQFNPNGLELFLSWHGRSDYTSGGMQGTGNLGEILKSYAFEGTGKTYPFLTVLRELKSDDTGSAPVRPQP